MCVRTKSADIGNNFEVATVRFTESIQRHVQCPTREIAGTTLRDVLEVYFADNQRARGYVLDDQGALRKHMAIFIDGRQVRDRNALSDRVDPDAIVDLIQSLSGGTATGIWNLESEN
jgi:molybdopterin synthase sulfur carrier subunit